MAKHRYSEFVDQVDIDAVEVALGWDPIERQGENDVGHCPDIWGLHKHGDTTGKFAIHREKRVYNCWVCGGGSLLSLVMEWFDMDVEDATEWLRQFTRGDLRSDGEFLDDFLEMLQDVKTRATTLPYFNEHVLNRYDDPVDWFHGRGLNDETIAKYNLRYVETMRKAAPIKQRPDGPEKIDDDYYGPTAIFPHYWKGRLVGWQNRWINDPDTPKWLAKYTNTTDFPKSDTLFNWDEAIAHGDPVVVVESVPTCLLLAQHDIPAVSYFGGEIKPAQLRLLRRLHQGVILAPDNDKVGGQFITKSTSYLEPYIEVKVMPPVDGPPGTDLGDLIKPELRDQIGLGVEDAIHEYLELSAPLPVMGDDID